jgi:hypothetical protein
VEHPPRSSDLTPLEFFLWGAPQNHVNCMTWSVKFNLQVPFLFSNNTERLLICWDVVVSNTMFLLVDIWNVCDFKRENITFLSLFICELWTFKVCTYILGHSVYLSLSKNINSKHYTNGNASISTIFPDLTTHSQYKNYYSRSDVFISTCLAAMPDKMLKAGSWDIRSW